MINSFSSYFELFAGLNLGYATIKGFREATNSELFSLEKRYEGIENDIVSLENKLELIVAENQDGLKMKDFKEKFQKEKISLEVQIERLIELGKGFQSVFLVTAIFCFFIIILGGFENYFQDFFGNKYSVIKLLSFANCIFFFFLLIIRPVLSRFNIPLLVLPSIFLILLCILLFPYVLRLNFVFSDWGIFFYMDSSLLVLLILIAIPPFPFIVFYVRRFRQFKEAQNAINTFTEEFKHKYEGFKIGMGFSTN